LSFTTVFADEIDFTYDGWDRECYLYKPSCIPDIVPDDFEVPLVFMIHGLGGVGVDNYDFSSLAEDSCFMVAFPSGVYNTWNCGPEIPYGHDVDDNSYMHALIDTIYNNYPLDTNRVYLTGHSMGGHFANHMNCTSTRFTAFASSGGILNGNYNDDNQNHDLCDASNGNYPYPITITHGKLDAQVAWEWAFLAGYHWLLNSSCAHVPQWPYDFGWPIRTGGGDLVPFDIDQLYTNTIETADTLHFDASVERYSWSAGCITEPAVEFTFINISGHAWHQPWNSPISTPLEHWNFLKQFSKDKMGPMLDSLTLPASETLDDEYFVNGETTPISILAIDNYSVAAMTISFSGFINVGGFDLTLTFDTDEKFINTDIEVVLDPSISTDNYETVQIVIADHHGNFKVYDLEALQELGLYQQMAVVNNITTSTDDDMLSPQTYALHQNYPNPFNPETSISYDLASEGLVSIKIHDLRGTLIKTLVNDVQPSGYKTIKWDGTNDRGQKVSAGLYLYRIDAEGFTDTKKMALLK
jgi:poly(3-hydroxybutyrate) depolymerase